MTIQIGNYSFFGDFALADHLQEASGVYAILGVSDGNGGRKVIDIGESGWVRTRVKCHDRATAWDRQGMPLRYAALYCDEASRMRIERELRTQFNPSCGDR